MKTVQTHYGTTTLKIGYYPHTHQPAVQLFQGKELIATLSRNIPEYDHLITGDEFFAKTYSENERIAKACLASGHFEDTGRRVKLGYVDIEIWRLK